MPVTFPSPPLLRFFSGDALRDTSEKRSKCVVAPCLVFEQLLRSFLLERTNYFHDFHLVRVKLKNHSAVFGIPFDVGVFDVWIIKVSCRDVSTILFGKCCQEVFAALDASLGHEEFVSLHKVLSERFCPRSQRESGSDVAYSTVLYRVETIH